SDIPADLPVDTSWDDIYQPTSSASSASSGENDDFDFESRRGTTESLFDHLMWQLNLTPMSDRDRVIAMAIVDAVEPSGMLSTSAVELHAGLLDSLEDLELDEVQAVLHRVQQFDPAGVAAHDLQECPL